MSRLIIIIGFLLAFIAACSQAETITPSSEVETHAISFDEIIKALEKQGLNLESAELPEENVFIQNLNGVSPEVYFIEGNTLSIYVFPSLEERKKGMENFEERTAAAGLEYSENVTKENILIFFVIEFETEKTISKVRHAITTLN